jgi:hypothetical protein
LALCLYGCQLEQHVRRVSSKEFAVVVQTGETDIEYRFLRDEDGLYLLRGVYASPSERIVSRNSILEFAISARPAGAHYPTEWVPSHGKVTGVAEAVEVSLTVDGEPLRLDAIGKPRPIRSFRLEQRFRAVNPHGGGTLWTHHLTHTLEAGRLHITSRLRFQQPTYIARAYFGMIAADTDLVPVLSVDGEAIPIPAGRKQLASPAASATFTGPRYTVHIAVEQRPEPMQPARLVRRANGVAKLYLGGLNGVTVQPGETITSHHTLRVLPTD